MFPLGSYPQLLFLIGAPDEVEVAQFSPGEIAQANFILKHGSKKRYDELVQGLSAQITNLRQKDSLYSKLGLYGSSTVKDELDAEVVRLDEADPDLAPHAAIYGNRFPKDNRDKPIKGRILSAVGGKVLDSTGLFGDSYWSEVKPETRLAGRMLTMITGPRAGVSYLITTHVFDSAVPYIRVEDDAAASIDDVNNGNRFRIDGPGLPQDDLDKWDRGNDWMIVSAILGTLTGAAGAVLTCAAIFNAADYWLDEGVKIPGNLAGRDIIIEGVGTRSIVSHNPVAGQITVDSGSGISGNERFKILSRSPAETGKQDKGNLRDGGSLEPGIVIRLTPSTIATTGVERAQTLKTAMAMVKRYARLRYHRFRGSHVQLRYLIRNAKAAVDQYEDERDVGNDIRIVAAALEIPIVDPDNPSET